MGLNTKIGLAVTQFFGADAQLFTYFVYMKRDSADAQFSEAVMPFFRMGTHFNRFFYNFSCTHVTLNIQFFNVEYC